MAAIHNADNINRFVSLINAIEYQVILDYNFAISHSLQSGIVTQSIEAGIGDNPAIAFINIIKKAHSRLRVFQLMGDILGNTACVVMRVFGN